MIFVFEREREKERERYIEREEEREGAALYEGCTSSWLNLSLLATQCDRIDM